MTLSHHPCSSLCVPRGLLTTPVSVWGLHSGPERTTISGASVLNPARRWSGFFQPAAHDGDFMVKIFSRCSRTIREALCATQASPEAQILVDRPRKGLASCPDRQETGYMISTAKIQIEMDKRTSLFKITDKIRQKCSGISTSGGLYGKTSPYCHSKHTIMSIFMEVVYRTAIRFSLKGKSIRIVNTNQWTDGGVSFSYSFYWSTEGYGVM